MQRRAPDRGSVRAARIERRAISRATCCRPGDERALRRRGRIAKPALAQTQGAALNTLCAPAPRRIGDPAILGMRGHCAGAIASGRALHYIAGP